MTTVACGRWTSPWRRAGESHRHEAERRHQRGHRDPLALAQRASRPGLEPPFFQSVFGASQR